jgi:hypothetical protein
LKSDRPITYGALILAIGGVLVFGVLGVLFALACWGAAILGLRFGERLRRSGRAGDTTSDQSNLTRGSRNA